MLNSARPTRHLGRLPVQRTARCRGRIHAAARCAGPRRLRVRTGTGFGRQRCARWTASLGSSALIDCRIDSSNAPLRPRHRRPDRALPAKYLGAECRKPGDLSYQAGEVAIGSPADLDACHGDGRPSRLTRRDSAFLGVRRRSAARGNPRRTSPRRSRSPPDDLRTRHVWDAETFRGWNSPGASSTSGCAMFRKRRRGDGRPCRALQRAINEHETVFPAQGCLPNLENAPIQTAHQDHRHQPVVFDDCCPSRCRVAISPIRPIQCPPCKPPTLPTPKPCWRFSACSCRARMCRPPRCSTGPAAENRSCAACFRLTGYTANDLFPSRRGSAPGATGPGSRWTISASLGAVAHLLGDRWHYGEENHPAEKLEELRKAAAAAVPDWPLIRVHGHGAGGLYPFYALDGRPNGPNSRRILVENTSGPFSIYHAQFQYAYGASEWKSAARRTSRFTASRTKGCP